MADTMNMTTGRPLRLLFSFALPLMLGNIFQQLYTVVDTAIIGQGVGMTALAALGTVDWLNWMFLGLASGFTQGFSVRVAQKFGQQDDCGLRRVIGASIVLSPMITVCGVLISQLGLPLFLQLLRVPESLYDNAQLYSRIILGGFPAVMFFNLCAAILRAVGDSKTPLYAMVAASVTNIVLDLVAVFVLGWGIAGAAAATVFSQCLSGFICAWKIRRNRLLRFGKADLQLTKAMSADLLRIGSPIAAKNIIIALGGITVQSVANGFSMSFIAGFTATNKLYGLLEIAALSYGFAVTTFVGQNFGAAKYHRIRNGVRSAIILSLITSLVIAGAMVLFGREITMLFISTEDLVQAAAAGQTAYHYLCVMSAALPMLYLLYVYLSALQGMGNTTAPMVSGIVEFLIRVSLALLIGWTGYQNRLFGAEVSAWIGGSLFLMVSYYRTVRLWLHKI